MNGKLSDKVIFFRKQFEQIISIEDISDEKRDMKLSALMTDMEKAFKVPPVNREDYNWENPNVISLYRKIADSRVTL